MRKTVSAVAALLLGFAFTTASVADDATVTLEGNIVCAKCTLKIEGVDECQSVLIVESEDADDAQYWLAPNAVAKEYGDVCTAIKPVSVTGSIEEKDGKRWIAATRIDPRDGVGSD